MIDEGLQSYEVTTAALTRHQCLDHLGIERGMARVNMACGICDRISSPITMTEDTSLAWMRHSFLLKTKTSFAENVW